MNESTTEFKICPSQTLETSALLSLHDGNWILINLFSYQILERHIPTDAAPVSDSYSIFYFKEVIKFIQITIPVYQMYFSIIYFYYWSPVEYFILNEFSVTF